MISFIQVSNMQVVPHHGYSSYTLPTKQRHHNYQTTAGKVRYTQAYAVAPPGYSTLPQQRTNKK